MTRPIEGWKHLPTGRTLPHSHPVDLTAADPGVAPLVLDSETGVLVPDLGWQQWTIAECAHYAHRLHKLHLPVLVWRYGWYQAACTCGRRRLSACPHAQWVRSWITYDHTLRHTLSPPVTAPQTRPVGLEYVFREPHSPPVGLVATCHGGVHIGHTWYPEYDRDAFRHQVFQTLTLHHPLGLRRDRLAWHWPPIVDLHRICYGCALDYSPTWSIQRCIHRRQARAWMYAPRWWRRCAGTPCHTWPASTPAHECRHSPPSTLTPDWPTSPQKPGAQRNPA